jgi:hypothetical protein
MLVRKVMRQPRTLWLVLLAVAGCFSATTISRRDDYERYLAASVAKSTGCPVERITMTPLGEEMFEETDVPARQRVDACGKQTDYVAGAHGYEPPPDPQMDLPLTPIE